MQLKKPGAVVSSGGPLLFAITLLGKMFAMCYHAHVYEIVFTKQASRALRRMPPVQAKHIRQKLRILAQDPYAPNNNVTKLQNRTGYRLRVGDYRVIYEIVENQLTIVVLKVGSRGQIYR